MSEPAQMTLSPREMALAKWIEALSVKVAADDRHRITMLCGAANFLTVADAEGEVPEPTKEEQRFMLTIKQGCEARGAKRIEAAVACLAVALASVKEAGGFQPA
jgi:hypothetical protein